MYQYDFQIDDNNDYFYSSDGDIVLAPDDATLYMLSNIYQLLYIYEFDIINIDANTIAEANKIKEVFIYNLITNDPRVNDVTVTVTQNTNDKYKSDIDITELTLNEDIKIILG